MSTKFLPFEMREVGDLASLVCLPLEEAGFSNAFSTRLGGVSPMPENALHLSFKNEDTDRVRENRRRFLTATKLNGYAIVTVQQTHSTEIRTIDHAALEHVRKNEQHEAPGDALISKEAWTLIGVKTADCLPILIGDPETGTMAAVHAGWKGTLGKIAEKTIEKMQRAFGVQPEHCLAAMGPAACAACYEVGDDVAGPFKENFSYAEDLLAPSPNSGKYFLDVRLSNAMQLLSAGLSPMNIFGADECTMHENELFFSHRQEGKNGNNVGRLLSVIGRRKLSA